MDDVNKKRCSSALIDSLCGELCSVKVMPHPIKRVMPWLVLAALYILVSVSFFGLRSDIGARMQEPIFLFEMILATTIAISAAFCSIWLCVPDMRGQKWMLAVPATLFSAFVLWTLLRAMLEEFNVPEVKWHVCYFEAIVFGAMPALAIFILSMKGKTTQPLLLSFMNTLAFGGFGYLGLRLTCASEDIAHICIFHILPYLTFGLLASILGSKLYRW